MKIKHLLLPIMVGMGSFMLNANAQTPDGNMQSTTKNALSFIENKGQVTDQFLEHRRDIDFKMAAGNGLNIFFGKGKIEYQWSERIKSEAEIAREANGLLHFDVDFPRFSQKVFFAYKDASITVSIKQFLTLKLFAVSPNLWLIFSMFGEVIDKSSFLSKTGKVKGKAIHLRRKHRINYKSLFIKSNT